MSEPVKKPNRKSPESYNPKKPEIVRMAKQAVQNEPEKERQTMGKLGGVRITQIPQFKAISSGLLTGDKIFGPGGFCDWFNAERSEKMVKNIAPYESPDFMWHEEGKSVWIWAAQEWVTEDDVVPYHLIDFEGGMYVVGVADENDADDRAAVNAEIMNWIKNSGAFELDDRPGHRGMGHRIGCDAIQEAIGMAQQEIFWPIKFKES